MVDWKRHLALGEGEGRDGGGGEGGRHSVVETEFPSLYRRRCIKMSPLSSSVSTRRDRYVLRLR